MIWKTSHEIAFIDSLLTQGKSQNSIGSVALLKNYIRSAKKRRDIETFGDIDPKKVIPYAMNILEGLQ